MQVQKIDDLEMIEIWSETDETRRARFTFPICNLTGAASSAVVYFEVAPGKHLGMHRDSAEEIVMIVSGSAEAIVGKERGKLDAGSLALIPAMVPHDIINVGDAPVRVVGFFSSATTVAVFDDPLAPIGKCVVGTPLPEEPVPLGS
jgi:quercetin dioxygenase-like cupin family protein